MKVLLILIAVAAIGMAIKSLKEDKPASAADEPPVPRKTFKQWWGYERFNLLTLAGLLGIAAVAIYLSK